MDRSSKGIMSHMYYTPELKQSPEHFRNYPANVDALREYYSVRIEVRCPYWEPDVQAEFHNRLTQYLSAHLVEGTWKVQIVQFKAFNYFWFIHNEDAVAFMLKYDGKRV